MRGRKPKPIQRKIIEGDASMRGVHTLEAKLKALPNAQRGLPDPPRHISRVAREQWKVWKRDLELMGADYRADAVVLEGACVNYARAVAADATLRREGAQIKEPIRTRTTGKIVGRRLKNHPAIAVSNTCWSQVRSFCSELGLSTVSRQRLSLEGSDNGIDDLMELLTRPRERKAPPTM